MTPTEIVLHHSAGVDGEGVDFFSIRDYHITVLGYRDVGYHALIERIGKSSALPIIGRPWDENGAHALKHNSKALGLCFVGNFEKEAPPEPMLVTGARVLGMWMRMFGIPRSAVYRHSDLNATVCPGAAFPFDALLDLAEGKRP